MKGRTIKDSRVHKKSPSKKTKDEEMLDRMHLSAMTSKNRNKAFRDLYHNTDYNLLLKRLKKAGSSTRGSKGKTIFQQQTPSEIDDAEIGLAISEEESLKRNDGGMARKTRVF